MCPFSFLQGHMTSTVSLHLPASLTPCLVVVPFPSFESLCHSVAQSDAFGCMVEGTGDINPALRGPFRKNVL